MHNSRRIWISLSTGQIPWTFYGSMCSKTKYSWWVDMLMISAYVKKTFEILLSFIFSRTHCVCNNQIIATMHRLPDVDWTVKIVPPQNCNSNLKENVEYLIVQCKFAFDILKHHIVCFIIRWTLSILWWRGKQRGHESLPVVQRTYDALPRFVQFKRSI